MADFFFSKTTTETNLQNNAYGRNKFQKFKQLNKQISKILQLAETNFRNNHTNKFTKQWQKQSSETMTETNFKNNGRNKFQKQ